MTGRWTSGLFASFLAIAMAACGGSMMAPQETPVSGTWSGTLGAGSGGGRALRVTWVAIEDATTVSGPATLLTSPAVTAVSISGTLVGSVAGGQLLLKFTGAPDTVPGSTGCSVSATGSASASSSSISGRLDVVFTSCEGLGLLPPAGDELILSRVQ